MLKMDTAHSSKTMASASQITWHCTPKDSNHHAKRFRNYKISYGWMYFHLVGSFISHEVGEINFTLTYINTFLKVDLNCFTNKKGDIEY
jgi:hypothetical protein